MTSVSAPSIQMMAPQMRAQLLYQQARSVAADQLWQATMGTGDVAQPGAAGAGPKADVDLDGFLTLLDSMANRGLPQNPLSPPVPLPPRDRLDGQDAPDQRRTSSAEVGHGGDAYRAFLSGAAERTGIPASALAAIIDAEAAKGSDGRWLPLSRNPRSSAAGLGQFLSGTWKDEAERPGTWLNQFARANDWLKDNGHIKGSAKSALLALRYDPRASIEAVADYALANLSRLRQAGISVGNSADSIARTAYFAHHLGVADAISFLGGTMDPHRAAKLLAAQIGATAAERQIEISGGAVAAHRGWLTHFVATRVRPDRFAALPA
jgi:hypothetical protein